MLVAAFGDAHAHAEALEAVIAAAEAAGADELWSLGDMVGGGPDPERAVALTRERCRVALLGNHDYGATGSVEPSGSAVPAPSARARSRWRASGSARRRSPGCGRASRPP